MHITLPGTGLGMGGDERWPGFLILQWEEETGIEIDSRTMGYRVGRYNAAESWPAGRGTGVPAWRARPCVPSFQYTSQMRNLNMERIEILR